MEERHTMATKKRSPAQEAEEREVIMALPSHQIKKLEKLAEDWNAPVEEVIRTLLDEAMEGIFDGPLDNELLEDDEEAA